MRLYTVNFCVPPFIHFFHFAELHFTHYCVFAIDHDHISLLFCLSVFVSFQIAFVRSNNNSKKMLSKICLCVCVNYIKLFRDPSFFGPKAPTLWSSIKKFFFCLWGLSQIRFFLFLFAADDPQTFVCILLWILSAHCKMFFFIFHYFFLSTLPPVQVLSSLLLFFIMFLLFSHNTTVCNFFSDYTILLPQILIKNVKTKRFDGMWGLIRGFIISIWYKYRWDFYCMRKNMVYKY